MKPQCEVAFWPMTTDCEGSVPCLYLDVLGLVTTAIGNLCHDVHVAMSMPFFRPDGILATPDDIRAEHTRVASMFCGMKGAEQRATGTQPAKVCPWRAIGSVCLAHQGWTAAMRATSLRLTNAGIEQIVMAKMRANDAELLSQYPAFESWPWQAQLATHSMAWACGSHFGGSHPGGYPKLAGLLRAGNFEGAAGECHINEAGNPGVIKRNVKNKSLYREAANAIAADAVPTVRSLDAVDSSPTPLPQIITEIIETNAASSPTIHPDPSALLRPEEWLEKDPDDGA